MSCAAEVLESVIVRIAGDSGDGIQLTGTQFTHETAIGGSDLATLPNFPAEIRAPAGSLAGVSSFQINFGTNEIFTPGDQPDVLVAMNPAAFKANLAALKAGGILICNSDTFQKKNLNKLGYQDSPLESVELQEKYRLFSIPISQLTKSAVEETSLSSREAERCKNFFTLGVLLWLYSRSSESTLRWIEKKFERYPEYVKANSLALKAGLTYAEATEIFPVPYQVEPAKLEPGEYRNANGSMLMAYGFVSAAQKSGLPLFLGAYPITPASDLLHELSKHKHLGVRTFQAEDEIAAICAAIGASYTGSLAVSSSSGPGIALKTEALALAVMTELPLVVVNIQRGGPSTGLPTKTEQSDLLQALYGRPGETPVCVLAASSPSSAFEMAYQACRIATKYMTPVILLSDGYISNSSEPWRIREPADLAAFEFSFAQQQGEEQFHPYSREESTLARPWALPGTPGLMHRIGGLEKEEITGNVSYDPANHDRMSRLRAEKIERIVAEIPPLEVEGPDSGELLVLAWGSTEGAIKEAVTRVRERGLSVSRLHLHYLNPLPADLGKILENFSRILVPEINLGQLSVLLRDRFLVDVRGFNSLRGEPLLVAELENAILANLVPE